MGIFQIISLVLTLILKFGPGLFSLGKDVYEAVESWSENEKALGKEPTGAEKAVKFNEIAAVELSAQNKIASPAKINLLREGVWALNNKKKLED